MRMGTFPLWALPLPKVDPLASFQISAPGSPSIGTVGVFTALVTSEGITCSDWETVDIGAPSSAVPSVGELKELFQGANKVLSNRQ